MHRDALFGEPAQHFRHGFLLFDVFQARAATGCDNFGRLATRAEHGLA